MICNYVLIHFYHICTSCMNFSQLIYVVTEIVINYGKNSTDIGNTIAADLSCTPNLFKSPMDSDSKFFLF